MKKVFASVLSLFIILSACTKQPPAPAPTPENEIKATPKPTPSPTPEVIYTNGLTGEVLKGKPEPLRPYAVMINNLKPSLPQCGIGEADVIYEVLAEGEITRMMAIFSSIDGVGNIGTIRSVRPYYLDISQSYDAILVHAGGSEQAYSDIANEGVENIDQVRGAYPDEIYFRDPDRVKNGTEHALFSTSEKLLEYVPILEYREEHDTEEYDYGFRFTENAIPLFGKSANEVNVVYGNNLKESHFTYDESEGVYHMKEFDLDYIDGNTDEKVPFTNVLILVSEMSDLYDELGHRDMDITKGGQGYFVNGGKYEKISWGMDADGTFYYDNPQGKELELGIGKTFICMIPTTSPDPEFFNADGEVEELDGEYINDDEEDEGEADGGQLTDETID